MSNLTLEEKIKMFPVTVYDRVVGWLTPVRNFNKGKAQERMDRKQFKIKNENSNNNI